MRDRKRRHSNKTIQDQKKKRGYVNGNKRRKKTCHCKPAFELAKGVVKGRIPKAKMILNLRMRTITRTKIKAKTKMKMKMKINPQPAPYHLLLLHPLG